MGLFDKFKKTSSSELTAPCNGNYIDITDTNDEMFSSKMLGDGIGIITSDSELYSPVDGEVTMIFPTKHALGIKTSNNIDILLHIGINTVELDGEPFEVHVKQNQKVQAGDLLVDVDFKKIEEKGYDATLMVVITNSDDYPDIEKNLGEKVLGEKVMKVN
ncbi:PTS sugar transporter subunit IIA [Breznakia pachnodae]|uniref:Glucose-specific phosphotransferase system IIA component n=1 Tax=Breznakia pachnodae TaxID=265178 RepID=A0ABU0E5P1_9FIRM|nr:PTS glucose transporter subunit IIA [Breznakia pachnodae]MDQ0362061.1 glucose-specific phosphotransferase system IIA component [Breznakia pachnodae]